MSNTLLNGRDIGWLAKIRPPRLSARGMAAWGVGLMLSGDFFYSLVENFAFGLTPNLLSSRIYDVFDWIVRLPFRLAFGIGIGLVVMSFVQRNIDDKRAAAWSVGMEQPPVTTSADLAEGGAGRRTGWLAKINPPRLSARAMLVTGAILVLVAEGLGPLVANFLFEHTPAAGASGGYLFLEWLATIPFYLALLIGVGLIVVSFIQRHIGDKLPTTIEANVE